MMIERLKQVSGLLAHPGTSLGEGSPELVQ